MKLVQLLIYKLGQELSIFFVFFLSINGNVFEGYELCGLSCMRNISAKIVFGYIFVCPGTFLTVSLYIYTGTHLHSNHLVDIDRLVAKEHSY